jgi:alpha-glucosidase
MLLCLRGTPVLYQGDEIGLVDTDVPHDQLRDPLGVAYWPAYAGRDAMRTPMPWRDTPGGGFTDPEVQPWLPFGDLSAFNVHDQRDDPTSMLTLARDLIALRRDAPGLQTGPYRSLDAPRGAWVWSRGDRIVVALNMASEDVTVSGIAGTVRVGTDGRRQGRHLGDGIRLRGWEAVVVERDDP